MNTYQKELGLGFWLAWALASAIGFGIGAVLGVLILVALRVPDSPAFPILFGAIFGAIGAFAQWIVLRRRSLDAGLWIPFSALAFLLAVSTAAGMDQRVASHLNPFFVIAGISGLLGGFLQGLILEKSGVPIGWWIAASLLGGLLGCTVNGSAVSAVQTNAAWQAGTTTFFLIWFRIGAPLGLGLGVTTGAALVWFSRNPQSRVTVKATSQGAR